MVKKSVKKRGKVSRAKPVSKKSSKSSGIKPVRSSLKKINMVGRRLVFFLVLFLAFLILDVSISNELWSDFFGLGTFIFGFISVALFLVLLVLWFMKMANK